jgi:hypothetical protein
VFRLITANVLSALLTTIALLGGCASLGPRTEGTSGPIAWRVENIAVVTRQVEGKPVDGQTYTVVIKNVTDRTLTFTSFEEIRSTVRTNPGMTRSSGQWVVGPGAEWRFDRFTARVCRAGGGCSSSGSTHVNSRITLTGTDDQGRPTEAQLDITLPPGDIGRTPIIR